MRLDCSVGHLAGSFGRYIRRHSRRDLTCRSFIAGSIVWSLGTRPLRDRRTVFHAVSSGSHLIGALQCSCLTVADVWSFGRVEMVQHRDAVWNAARQRLAVAAPAALDCALGLGQQLETMVEALREEHAEDDVPCGWAPGALM
ncbi:hypothetical protein MTO96_046511 [Rhipicephalus appendiculatus]